MKLTLSLILTFFASNLWAQNRVGNGGDIVLCEKKEKTGQITTTKIMLLDFYEDANYSEKSVTSKDPWKIAQERFENLQKFSEKLSQQYLKRLADIKVEFDFKDKIVLSNVEDSKHIYLPEDKDCRIEQIAIRKNTRIAKDPRFIVSKKLWDKLSPLNQAGLITHEIIYEHLFNLEEPNSIKARTLNRALFSDTTTEKNFWTLIKSLDLPIYP